MAEPVDVSVDVYNHGIFFKVGEQHFKVGFELDPKGHVQITQTPITAKELPSGHVAWKVIIRAQEPRALVTNHGD